MFKTTFRNCKTIEDLKSLFKKLSKIYHPDLGGDTELFKQLLNAYEQAIKMFSYENFKAEYVDSYMMILQKIVNLDIEIEIIGTWVYCFRAFECKDFLKSIGFWFSSKHKAWVYSGGVKRNRKSRYTLTDIERMHGYTVVKERTQLA